MSDVVDCGRDDSHFIPTVWQVKCRNLKGDRFVVVQCLQLWIHYYRAKSWEDCFPLEKKTVFSKKQCEAVPVTYFLQPHKSGRKQSRFLMYKQIFGSYIQSTPYAFSDTVFLHVHCPVLGLWKVHPLKLKMSCSFSGLHQPLWNK